MQIWSSLSLVRVNKKKKIRSTQMCAPKGRFTAARQGCATCYETVHRTVSAKFVLAKFGVACRWFESIDRMKNTEHTNTCAERALYRSAPRLCNLLRNSPPDCFCQICKQIWSSLSLVRVNKIAKEKPIRLCVSAFLWLPKLDSNQRPCG